MKGGRYNEKQDFYYQGFGFHYYHLIINHYLDSNNKIKKDILNSFQNVKTQTKDDIQYDTECSLFNQIITHFIYIVKIINNNKSIVNIKVIR